MTVTENQLMVLTGIADDVVSLEGWTRKQNVLQRLREDYPGLKYDRFAGSDGANLFEETVFELCRMGLAKTKEMRGHTYVGLEHDAVKVDGLNVSGLL